MINLEKLTEKEFRYSEKEVKILLENNKAIITDYLFSKKKLTLKDLIEIDKLRFSDNSFKEEFESLLENDSFKNKVEELIKDVLPYIEITTSESIPEFKLITANGLKANTDLAREAIALSIKNVPNNTTDKFLLLGLVKNPLWNFTPNEKLFLNGENISHTIPTTSFIQKVGIAITTDSFLLKIEKAIYQ